MMLISMTPGHHVMIHSMMKSFLRLTGVHYVAHVPATIDPKDRDKYE